MNVWNYLAIFRFRHRHDGPEQSPTQCPSAPQSPHTKPNTIKPLKMAAWAPVGWFSWFRWRNTNTSITFSCPAHSTNHEDATLTSKLLQAYNYCTLPPKIFRNTIEEASWFMYLLRALSCQVLCAAHQHICCLSFSSQYLRITQTLANICVSVFAVANLHLSHIFSLSRPPWVVHGQNVTHSLIIRDSWYISTPLKTRLQLTNQQLHLARRTATPSGQPLRRIHQGHDVTGLLWTKEKPKQRLPGGRRSLVENWTNGF